MGTLDYFALRSDKQAFLERDGLVAYAIYGGICLVSPDPICAPEERDELWSAFRRFADDHGWSVAVLGAGEEWLGAYRRSGMHERYIGDEGVVDVRTFSLEGGARKGLRQAVNRIAKYGYTISFHDPNDMDADAMDGVRAILVKRPRGEVERGFSMTLGRIFDPRDEGLLLAVAHGPDGAAVAFCQFVPAPGINGFSLDLMRRDDAEHPNGLLDFILVRTIERLKGLRWRVPGSQLCRHAGRSRRRGRRRNPTMAAPADVGLDADRIALALQRQVRAGVAASLRRLGRC